MRRLEEIGSSFQPTDALEGITSFFLVGIGGAGMSALARMLLRRGYKVAGSDAVTGPVLDQLRLEGAECRVGHCKEAISEGQALVVSDAIDLRQSPEVLRSVELGNPIVRRSQALGWLLRTYKVIAVTGTHGKSTTTALLGAGLEAAGLDPLVVVGAAVPLWNGPVREGSGQYAVVEACEAYDSFHDLEPHSVVLTNLELDHVDFHKSYERLRESVVRFVDKIPPEGWLIYCSEDRGACEVAELSSVRAVPYGASDEWQRQMANILGVDFSQLPPFPLASELALPGKHNLLNAAGALTAAATVQADLELVELALRRFGGVERRLQVIQEEPIVIIDDYAHHPSEIAASLSAIRERFFSNSDRVGRLIVVYQPHLYSRTAGQYQEFASALDLADHIFLTDIYPAREAPMPGVSSALIAELSEKAVSYIPNRHLLPREVASIARPGDVVVGMGAGTIGEFAGDFALESKRSLDLKSGSRPLKVVILYGGDSAEREVSLHSGLAAKRALDSLGYDAFLLDVSEHLLKGKGFESLTGPLRPDVAFLALHGTRGEDGAIQGLLELLHIPYTGAGILCSATCMDKAATKVVLEGHGIKTPRGVTLASPHDAVPFPAPVIVKPNSQGSTVGLSFVSSDSDLREAIAKAFQYDDRVLVEEWIVGVEISTPVLSGRALTPVEIVPASGMYNFAGKYVPGATQEVVPAKIGPEMLEQAKKVAELAHQALGCKGATRTDAIVRGSEMFVLEVNTLPGLTTTSLLPNSAAYEGISFPELCRRLVLDALANDAQKNQANQ
jgi:UDP-N-acetylmuramate--L-alanine ligase